MGGWNWAYIFNILVHFCLVKSRASYGQTWCWEFCIWNSRKQEYLSWAGETLKLFLITGITEGYRQNRVFALLTIMSLRGVWGSPVLTLHHTYGPLAWDSLNPKQLSLSSHNTLNKLQGRETEWSIGKVGKKMVAGKQKNKLGCQEDARSPLVLHCAVTIHDVQRRNTKA